MKVVRDLLAGVVIGLVIARTISTGLDGAASAEPSNQESAAPREFEEMARIVGTIEAAECHHLSLNRSVTS